MGTTRRGPIDWEGLMLATDAATRRTDLDLEDRQYWVGASRFIQKCHYSQQSLTDAQIKWTLKIRDDLAKLDARVLKPGPETVNSRVCGRTTWKARAFGPAKETKGDKRRRKKRKAEARIKRNNFLVRDTNASQGGTDASPSVCCH